MDIAVKINYTFSYMIVRVKRLHKQWKIQAFEYKCSGIIFFYTE